MEYRWYAIQTTAGHEKKVRNLVAKRIEEDPRPEDERLVRQALVPVQDVVEINSSRVGQVIFLSSAFAATKK